MIKPTLLLVFLATSIPLLLSCESQTGNSILSQSKTFKPFGGSASPIPPCSATSNAPADGDVGVVVRIVVDPANPARNVKYKPANPTNDDADDDNNNGTPNVDHAQPSSPYDVDLTDLKSYAGKYLQVRVVLKNENLYQFYRLKNFQGTGQVTGGSGPILCGSYFGGKNRMTAIFSEKITASTGGGGSTFQPFDIIIFPKGQPDSPFYIDPKITNNG